jgi:hypothetical protein
MRNWLRATVIAVMALVLSTMVVVAVTTPQQVVLWANNCVSSIVRDLCLGSQCGYSYTYFVNSATGSDSNNGTTFSAPFQHLSSIPSLTIGQSVCLEGGSYFREFLDLGASTPISNVTVSGCGPGALPIVDSSDVMASSNWTKTIGLTNTYNTTVAVPFPGSTVSVPFVEAFENGNFLAYEASQALVDSTPGSYTVNSMAGSTGTIYIHASDGSNPASNGKLYEYTSRPSGIYMTCTAGCVAQDIHFKRNGTYNGALAMNGDGSLPFATNIIVDQGNRHSILMAFGTLTNSVFNDAYSPTVQGGGNMMVFFESAGSGNASYSTGNTFNYGATMRYADATNAMTATYNHSATGTFGTFYHYNNNLNASSFYNVSGMVSGGNISINGGKTTDFQGVASAVGTISVSNYKYKTTNQTNSTFIGLNGNAATVSGVELCMANVHQGAIRTLSAAASSINVANSVFYEQSAQNNTVAFIADYFGNLSMTVNNTTIDETNLHYYAYAGATSGETFTGNNNNYVAVNAYVLNGVSKATLPLWQSFTSQDAASVTTGSGASACN